MKQTDTIQRRMAIQQQIEKTLNAMIRDMKELVDGTGIARSQMDKSQLSNLRNVAMETPSAELVRAFILYQVGRDTGGKNWRYKNFGESLVTRLNQERTRAADIVKAIDKGEQTPSDEAIDDVWIELVRHYIGQLNRYFYYRKEVKNGVGL